MLWSILICTLAWRERQFLALLDGLLPQAEAFPGQVEVVALRNNGELLLNDYREAMLRDPLDGEYISFVDDDDLVADYYVADVMEALAGSPDVVGFTTAVEGCGGATRNSFSITNRPSREARDGCFYKTISCWSPVRTSLARKATYIAWGIFEDAAFAANMGPYLLQMTEARVSRPLLTYTGAQLDSNQWGGPLVPIGALAGRRGPEERPVIASPSFRWYEGEIRAGCTPVRVLPPARMHD